MICILCTTPDAPKLDKIQALWVECSNQCQYIKKKKNSKGTIKSNFVTSCLALRDLIPTVDTPIKNYKDN